jgi:hypothetical protein
MFAQTIIDSDAFLTMSLSAQALYFHLSMRGDDEGFVNKPKSVMRTIGANEDDLKILIAKNFIIPFDSGVVVIKHWKIHNYIRGDRLKGTVYQDEKSQLTEKENGSYTMIEGCQPIVSQLSVECQHRLGKYSIGKDSIDKSSKDICVVNSTDTPKKSSKFIPPTVDQVKEYCKERNNTIDAEKFINHYAAANWFRGKTKLKDWKACVRTWEQNEKDKPTYQKPDKSQRTNFEQRQYQDEYYDNFFTNTSKN